MGSSAESFMTVKKSRFFIIKHDDGTYGIECLLYIRKDKWGRYPAFITEQTKGKNGDCEKYYLLVKDCYTSFKEACINVDKLNQAYTEVIKKCEESGDWKRFPFRRAPLVYFH